MSEAERLDRLTPVISIVSKTEVSDAGYDSADYVMDEIAALGGQDFDPATEADLDIANRFLLLGQRLRSLDQN